MRGHTIAIVAGLAIGAFVGYEFATTLNNYPPYSLIANYYTNQIISGVTSAAAS